MADLNSCAFIGRVTKDATLATVGAKETPVCKFSIANNTGFGQYAKTNYFEVQMWGKAATAVCQYLTKGKQVAVSGALEANNWTGNDGVMHTGWVLTANNVSLLASPQGTKPANEAPAESYQNAEPDTAVF